MNSDEEDDGDLGVSNDDDALDVYGSDGDVSTVGDDDDDDYDAFLQDDMHDVPQRFGEFYDDEGIEIANEDEESEGDEDMEVEGSTSAGGGNTYGKKKKKKMTFDTGLPTTHSYLGDDLEQLHGRTVHADGDTLSMPLFHVPNVVIAPGQILPLNLFHPQAVSMMKKVIDADKTFGLIISSDRNVTEFAGVGVTCEIYSVKEDVEHGISQLMLKAEGRQRFKILQMQPQLDGVLLGKIRILPDAYILPQPRGSLICAQQYSSGNTLRSQVISNKFHLAKGQWSPTSPRYLTGFNHSKVNVLCTSVSSIQGWVYKLYNPYFLMDCLLNEIRSWNENLQFDTVPNNPVEFSHWITANLPFTNDMKIELLRIDSASLRLRRQIQFMKKCASTLVCERCSTTITDKNDLFSLSKRGPMGAYVNSHGYVHETVTFYQARNLVLQGEPSEQFSWFPGYAWTIAACKKCRRHLGWKFTACDRKLKPSKFWGLVRAALKPVFKKNKEDEESVPLEPMNSHESSSGEIELNPEQYESNI